MIAQRLAPNGANKPGPQAYAVFFYIDRGGAHTYFEQPLPINERSKGQRNKLLPAINKQEASVWLFSTAMIPMAQVMIEIFTLETPEERMDDIHKRFASS